MNLKNTHKMLSACRLAYVNNPNAETLKQFVLALIQGDKIHRAVGVITHHIEKFGLKYELIFLSNWLVKALREILVKRPSFLGCRVDIIKLLTATNNFSLAASILEEGISHHDDADLEKYRQLLIKSWQPYLGARRYIHPKYTIEDFFERINRENLRYVVLRWFESLPDVAP